MKYPVFQGIQLSEGSSVNNFRLEHINDPDGVPDNIVSTGRFWFNQTLQKVQYTYLKDTTLKVGTININEAGWKDLLGSFSTAKTGTAVAPVWANMGNGYYAWRFDNAKDTGLQIQYHTTHDIDYTKKAVLHIHWCPASTNVGNVLFRCNYIICKGHSQGQNMMAVSTGTFDLLGTTKGILGEHIITEQALANGINLLEPDCLVIMNISRLGTHTLDTFTGSIYGFTADFHYYSEKATTPGIKPNFDTISIPVSI